MQGSVNHISLQEALASACCFALNKQDRLFWHHIGNMRWKYLGDYLMILSSEVFEFYHFFIWLMFFWGITFNKAFKQNNSVFQSPCDNSAVEGSRSCSEVVHKTQKIATVDFTSAWKTGVVGFSKCCSLLN